jgi:nucleotide-binding universal stress UspA family protein
MFKHALIATDGSELSTRTLATGLSLAKALEAKVTIVTVTEPRTNLIPDPAVVASPASDYDSALATVAKTMLATCCVPGDPRPETIIVEPKGRGASSGV